MHTSHSYCSVFLDLGRSTCRVGLSCEFNTLILYDKIIMSSAFAVNLHSPLLKGIDLCSGYRDGLSPRSQSQRNYRLFELATDLST